jgi:hypothetical protein
MFVIQCCSAELNNIDLTVYRIPVHAPVVVQPTLINGPNGRLLHLFWIEMHALASSSVAMYSLTVIHACATPTMVSEAQRTRLTLTRLLPAQHQEYLTRHKGRDTLCRTTNSLKLLYVECEGELTSARTCLHNLPPNQSVNQSVGQYTLVHHRSATDLGTMISIAPYQLTTRWPRNFDAPFVVECTDPTCKVDGRHAQVNTLPHQLAVLRTHNKN